MLSKQYEALDMSFKNNLNQPIQRRYIISSSFKMAMLFTILLSFSIFSWIYIIYSSVGSKISQHVLPLSIGIFCTLIVVAISYLISIFVVKKINHISSSAASIVNTKDFSRRIDSNTSWDDLSNLSNILNILFSNMDNLISDIKNVTNNIAHDLKTPLTRLKNRLENLAEIYPNEDTKNALKECDQLLEIFNSLLRLNRLEHGREKLIKKRVDIQVLINDAMELYEPVFDEKNIILICNFKNKMLNIDKNLIFQSIVNILDNCYKYSGENSIISITGVVNQNNYTLTIADTGSGISSQNHDKIFERFFREDKSRSLVSNGLGLALVKNIIELHGGKIFARNNIPKGLQIVISLPLH